MGATGTLWRVAGSIEQERSEAVSIAGQAPPLPENDPRVGRILDIMAKETALDRSRLRLEATIEELGIPSLDIVQTVFELENAFDIELPVIADHVGAEFATVGDLVRHVLATIDKTAAGTAAPPGKVAAGSKQATAGVTD